VYHSEFSPRMHRTIVSKELNFREFVASIRGIILIQLEMVLPQAVHTNADYVPDFYCLSTSTEYNDQDKTLKVSLCKPHQLKVGDKIKAFAGDGMQEQYVSAVNNEKTFTLSNWEIKQAGMNPGGESICSGEIGD
jgi:hypothetical protein